MNIYLRQMYPIPHPEHYKLHLACYNGTFQPLDVFVRDREDWDGWNRWRGSRDDFNRPYIFSLIDFYPQRNTWLFGGAYRILSRQPVNRSRSYEIELLEESQPFIGRLKVALERPGRARAVNFENHYNSLVVAEVLPGPYTGEPFRGYDEIDIAFSMLENIVTNQHPDWKTALENAKGVYLITDTSNGKRYVGSAYSENGIWSRWTCYIGTGHGNTDELTQLITQYGIEYARQHFRFALLEHITVKTDDKSIIQREQYWKKVLLSRGDYGYNRN
ncbi:MAG TPA: GIY-YIG nuclease family protein [Chthonomonadaceae bacterium]|nr:GIY-YIG nuclease family protein [Chthonomonadaceae bacterium]